MADLFSMRAQVLPDGSKMIYNVTLMRQVLLTLAGEEIVVSLNKPKKLRSVRFNDYYHAVVVKICADYFGYEPDEMHEALKYRFLRVEGDGHALPYVRSTKDLTNAELKEFVEKIQRWMSQEYDVKIPDPGQTEFL